MQKFAIAAIYFVVGGIVVALVGCGVGAVAGQPDLGSKIGAAVGAVLGLAAGAKNGYQ